MFTRQDVASIFIYVDAYRREDFLPSSMTLSAMPTRLGIHGGRSTRTLDQPVMECLRIFDGAPTMLW